MDESSFFLTLFFIRIARQGLLFEYGNGRIEKTACAGKKNTGGIP